MRRLFAIVLAATAMALAGTMELECGLFSSVWLLVSGETTSIPRECYAQGDMLVGYSDRLDTAWIMYKEKFLKCTYQSGMLDYRCIGKWSGDTTSVDTVTLESSDIVKTYFDVKKVLR